MARTNRLAGETSPYLRQHADNPVDWYPWGPEALSEARRRDVPLLISVGYSACHWCHVMAHESFEDPDTAGVMNDLFVNIKVDREERPDIDAVYMEATQAINGGGGWPMTVFCLPDGRPFFAGTYFPRPRFVALMDRIDSAWHHQREALESDAGKLADAVRRGTDLPGQASGGAIGTTGGTKNWAGRADATAAPSNILAETAGRLMGVYDAEWGGFGRAPKFPQPAMVELLLRAAADDRSLLEPLTTTLDAMASGGIYDHLAGGFARYATDRQWLVPHFEKMLYDNALLIRLYTHAWQLTGKEEWQQVVSETVEYLLRKPMRQPAGGFSSAEDADSEGVEGRFYVWSSQEFRKVADSDAAAEWYGVTAEGNWEGKNILWRPERGKLKRPADIEKSRLALLKTREQRVRPGLDDKVLTEWNAMAVAALAEAGAAMNKPHWIEASVQTAEFLLQHLRRDDGRWLRSWQALSGSKNGRAQHLAYAADLAWLTEAFVRLAEATGEARWITHAREAADNLLAHHADDQGRGLYTTADDAETLIARPKDTYDGAIPSANSVAAQSLARLGALTGEDRYTEAATTIVAALRPALAHAPTAFCGMVAAADLLDRGRTEVVITGDREDLLAVARRRYLPRAVLAWGEPYPSPLWEGRTGELQAGRAFVCRDYTCQAPTTDADTFSRSLDLT